MEFHVAIVCLLLVGAVVLFVTETLPVDTVALLVTACLMLSGILTPAEGLSGFSHEATITIAAMFVLSEGIRRTGALNSLGDQFVRLGRKNIWWAAGLIMPLIGVISAFVNNTAAVAIFIPVILRVAQETDISPSRLLMPLSFAAMFGGVCTLIGTSTNILVSSLARDHGIASFEMFEFTPFGLVVFGAGCLYLLLVGIRLIPERRPRGSELADSYEIEDYLTDILLEDDFEHLGKQAKQAARDWELDLEILLIFRDGKSLRPDRNDVTLEPGDILRIHGSADQIEKLLESEGLVIQPRQRRREENGIIEHASLVEVVIGPDSGLVNQAISQVSFYSRFGSRVLAVRQRGELKHRQLTDFTLSGGDTLLLATEKERIQELQEGNAFVVVSELSRLARHRRRMPVALGILSAVVLSAAFDLLPIVTSATAGVVAMVLTGCLKAEQVHEAIHWRVIFLLAGVIPLGLAMEKTGLAARIGDAIVAAAGDFGPVALLSGFFLVSMLLTEIISNQATATLLVPIAVQAAHSQGIDPRPLLIAITFAASLSFMTPVGYQTNTLIYGPGQYHFTDFTRVGAPLNLIFWILGTLLIPIFWPL